MKSALASEQPIRIDTAARFKELADLLLDVVASDYARRVEKAATLIGEAFETGHKLLICGNGGSSSDAQHLAGEMVVRFQTNRRALPALALSADSAVLTACANDFGYSLIFARQIESGNECYSDGTGMGPCSRSPLLDNGSYSGSSPGDLSHDLRIH
jgi:SIS domain